MRVILPYKNTAPDRLTSHAGLGITAAHQAISLRSVGIRADAVGVAGGEELEQLIDKNPDITHAVMLAQWIHTGFVKTMVMKRPHVKFASITHSDPAFLAVDSFAVRTIREQMDLEKITHNFRVGGNSKRFCDAVTGTFNVPALYLPNLYPVGEFNPKRGHVGGKIRLGLFGAIRQMKNMLVGAWAALKIADDLGVQCELHISSGREEHGDGVLNSIRALVAGSYRLKLVESGWMDWQTFRRYVRTMDLMLQPSFTESFNNVTADGISEGVPSVVGDTISWVPKYWRAPADDVIRVAETGKKLLSRGSASYDGYKALQQYTDSAKRTWTAYLDGKC